jgi:hypothetical protein
MPYGHDGVFKTLDEVVRFHLRGGGPKCHDPQLTKRELSDDDVGALVDLLNQMQGQSAPLPWSFWPSIPKTSSVPTRERDGGARAPAGGASARPGDSGAAY